MVTTSAPAADGQVLTGWRREIIETIERELREGGNRRPCMITVRFDGAGAFQVLVAKPVKRIAFGNTP
jgi:hypothetical protein